ncbi:MAG: MBL fold metallo-hydrolase [Wenzhouxiangellaceae bacterium]
MAKELHNNNGHTVVAFRDLVTGDAVQSNQFLIINDNHAALIDPGGELTYSRLFLALSRYTSVKNLDFVLVSHQDPDVVASINKWLVGTDCHVVVPGLWSRFIAHFTKPDRTQGRITTIPDRGATLKLGQMKLLALPAHFLHAEGNFHFYDPISKILFSGDMGANLTNEKLDEPVKQFSEILPYMDGFHKRYMASNKACRLWAEMVRQLDIKLLVPQHGRCLQGQAINDFIDWISELYCGVDLIDANWYRIPA